MKLALSFLIGLTVLFGLSTAQARPGRTCTVTYKACKFAIGGFCVKWKSKSTTIRKREARHICEDLRRRHGQIKKCNVSACGRIGGPRHRESWQMETRNGRVLRDFGTGNDAKFECERALQRKQCRRGENPHAMCVGYYQGEVFETVGPFCRGRDRRDDRRDDRRRRRH